MNFLAIIIASCIAMSPTIANNETTHVQELVLERAYLLGHPMHEEKVRELSLSILNEKTLLDPALTLAVIEIESKYDTKAKSSKNCGGLMQLAPATAKKVAKKIKIKRHNIYSIPHNIKIGVWYLSELIRENKSTAKGLTIYNMGWKNYVKNGKKTSKYARLVMKRYRRIKSLLENKLYCKNH